jgi:hypothetical protein
VKGATQVTRGPKTDAGRAAVRLNAVRHGVLARTPVIPEVESIEEWEAHRDGLIESLQPEGYLEEALAERVAETLWRQRRVVRFEQELIGVQQQEVAERLAERESRAATLRGLRGLPSPGHVDAAALQRERAASYLLERLPQLGDDAPLTGAEVGALLFDMARRWDVDLDSLKVAGIPHDGDWEAYPGWTVGLLREALSAFARRLRRRLETVLAEEQDRLAIHITQDEEALVRQQRDEQRLRGELLLPDDNALDKLMRYEAHLNRQFYQALHELEALQTRRRGGQAPLARLDVHGMPGTSS